MPWSFASWGLCLLLMIFGELERNSFVATSLPVRLSVVDDG